MEKDPDFTGKYPFETRLEAEEFLRRSNALTDYKNHSSGLAYLKGKKKFIELDKMVTLYLEDLKGWAPESHESKSLFFCRYVLPFFIFIQEEENFLKWHLYFMQFKNWLENEARTKTDYSNPKSVDEKNRLLSYSSKNHCIGALNGFYRSMRDRGVLPSTFSAKCSFFPKHLVNRGNRTYKDLILDDEFEELQKKLEKHEFYAAKEFSKVAYNTGMRFNEIYSLSMDDLYFVQDVADGGLQKWVIDKLEEFGKTVWGYIVLTSQVRDKAREPDANKNVERKPLKGRKTMLFKDGRIIPITCKETMNILTERYNRCVEEFNNGKLFGSEYKDYFLFDEHHSDIYGQMRSVGGSGFHIFRHGFATKLVGLTKNKELAKIITGHGSDESFSRYLHTYEGMVMNAKKETRLHRLRPRLMERVHKKHSA